MICNLIKLCFSNAICSKVTEPKKVIMCKLKIYFLPPFFYVMIHLIIHYLEKLDFMVV